MSGVVTIIKIGKFMGDLGAAKRAAIDEGERSIEENIHPYFDAWCPKDTGQMVGSWDSVFRKDKDGLTIGYQREGENGHDVAAQCENDPNFGGRVPGTGPRPLGRAVDAGGEQVVKDMGQAYIDEVTK
jgi:hypothetical protein